MTKPSMLETLRSETNELHQQIEVENLAHKIIDHSISKAEYIQLLQQNYIAYAATEKAFTPHLDQLSGQKHQALANDLQQLAASIPSTTLAKTDFSCTSIAEAFGAAYVVEGSALGGMLIAKNLKECPQLSDLATQHFFDGDKAKLKPWRAFCKALNDYPFSETEKQAAIAKAKETFRFFGNSLSLPKEKLA